MGKNLSKAGTVHVRAALERALDSSEGIKIIFDSEGAARHFRQLFHSLRNKDREKSKKQYPIDSPYYNTSIFDELHSRLDIEENGKASLTFIRAAMLLKELTVIDLATNEEIET